MEDSDGENEWSFPERPDGPPQYPFHGANADVGYCLFPSEMEDNRHIFFHGTAAKNLEPILEQGFKSLSLPSVSYAKSSSLALKYACDGRSELSPQGCVIAVFFDDLGDPRIISEAFGVHVYDSGVQPRIIGYCVVPKDYEFI